MPVYILEFGKTNKKQKGKKEKRAIIPPLRDISLKEKTSKYKLSDSTYKRRKAINEGIMSKVKNKKTKAKKEEVMIKAAKEKKARFNVLRIYRRYKNPKECKIITEDMKYIDRKYLKSIGGKTNDIC